jgi:outer membrane protein OmpA-like peptidoglycan-associated protein
MADQSTERGAAAHDNTDDDASAMRIESHGVGVRSPHRSETVADAEDPASDAAKKLKQVGPHKRVGRNAAHAKESSTSQSSRTRSPTVRTRASDQPDVMDLFQQRISAPGLPIAPQFLSAKRRAELDRSSADLTAPQAASNEAETDAAVDEFQSIPASWSEGIQPRRPEPVTVYVDIPTGELLGDHDTSPLSGDSPPPMEEDEHASKAPAVQANLTAAKSTHEAPPPAQGAAPRAPISASQPSVRSVIAADSLVFPEIARPREGLLPHGLESGPLQLTASDIADHHRLTRGEDEASPIGSYARMPRLPRGRWIARWWLAPAIAIAIVASLFIFDYRALLATRGAPTQTEAIRTPNASPDARKSINLPGGKKIDVRADGTVAHLAAYLINRAAPIGQSFFLDEVTFEHDSSELSPKSAEQIRQIAQILQAYPNAKARIEGHAERSNETINARLITAERAAAVKAALAMHGIDHGRLDSRGLSADRAASVDDSPEQRLPNRRIDMVITGR